MTTRGARPGSPTTTRASAGPGSEQATFSRLPASSPALASSVPRAPICVVCGEPILEGGVTITRQWMKTQAHTGCAVPLLEALDP